MLTCPHCLPSPPPPHPHCLSTPLQIRLLPYLSLLPATLPHSPTTFPFPFLPTPHHSLPLFVSHPHLPFYYLQAFPVWWEWVGGVAWDGTDARGFFCRIKLRDSWWDSVAGSSWDVSLLAAFPAFYTLCACLRFLCVFVHYRPSFNPSFFVPSLPRPPFSSPAPACFACIYASTTDIYFPPGACTFFSQPLYPSLCIATTSCFVPLRLPVPSCRQPIPTCSNLHACSFLFPSMLFLPALYTSLFFLASFYWTLFPYPCPGGIFIIPRYYTTFAFHLEKEEGPFYFCLPTFSFP